MENAWTSYINFILAFVRKMAIMWLPNHTSYCLKTCPWPLEGIEFTHFLLVTWEILCHCSTYMCQNLLVSLSKTMSIVIQLYTLPLKQGMDFFV